jgi:hypothetical protein
VAVTPNRGLRGSLIALSEVERVFNANVVASVARTAKLPSQADIACFGESIRIAVRIFLEAKARLSAPRLRAAIERLYQLNTRAEGGSDRAALALARAVDEMPADVWRWLASCNTGDRCEIPTAEEILSPALRQKAVEQFRPILSYGGRVVVGRKRSGRRRSRSFKPLLRVPKVGRGHPRGEAEREFIQWLAVAYVEVTERPPPRTAHYDVEIRGPFSRFVHRCFELVGAPTGNVTRLLNEYGAPRRAVGRRHRRNK